MARAEYQEIPGSAVLTVSELSRCIRGVIEAEELFVDVWIRGEISNFIKHASGHRYFSLKDESAVIKAVIWANGGRTPAASLENGMSVLARGRVSVYEKQGQYQLVVNEIVPEGAGSLYIAYEQLKAKLLAEGLFDVANKIALPILPQTIGIVTSATAAALRDMVSIAKRRFPSVNILLIPALMQGAGSESSVVEAIRTADSIPDIDVVVVGRGGGSIEDLWTFNSESVVRAIAGCNKPIVSAIGHETDFTLSDMAADLRAATPSAAIELILPECDELRSHVLGLVDRMRISIESSVERKAATLKLLLGSPSIRYPMRMVENRSQEIDILSERLQRSFDLIVKDAGSRVGTATMMLESLSPLGTLARGYAIVRDADTSRVLRSVDEINVGESIETRLSDGRLISRVEEVIKE